MTNIRQDLLRKVLLQWSNSRIGCGLQCRITVRKQHRPEEKILRTERLPRPRLPVHGNGVAVTLRHQFQHVPHPLYGRACPDDLALCRDRSPGPFPLRSHGRPHRTGPHQRLGDALAEFVTNEAEARVRHTYGRAYPDVLRGFRGDFSAAPDLVARPRTEAEAEQVLAWATDAKVATLPYGGGTSVVGGVEPKLAGDFRASLSLDMGALNRVLELEKSSLHARIQAGALGPELERGLAAEGLTLRHFPQSFEFSTLGGWIATRAGGHFATLHTHIDELEIGRASRRERV